MGGFFGWWGGGIRLPLGTTQIVHCNSIWTSSGWYSGNFSLYHPDHIDIPPPSSLPIIYGKLSVFASIPVFGFLAAR